MGLTSGQVFAGYQIVRKLGAGGMGEVYLAQHPRLPRRDALKVLPANLAANESFRRRFIREADLAAGLEHPNVVDVYDRGEINGQLWITMRYIDGRDAADELSATPGGLPVDDVTQIVAAVADALDHAHAHNLLHRDVKPANILLTKASEVRSRRRILLADFGIARPMLGDSRLTATNLTVGSFAYSSPEQLLGQDLNGRADQYSLACTAYQLLVGSTPFVNTNAAAIIGQHMSATPPAITTRRPDLPATTDDVFARALQKDPGQRFDSCTEFADALATALSTADGSTPAPPTLISGNSDPGSSPARPHTPTPRPAPARPGYYPTQISNPSQPGATPTPAPFAATSFQRPQQPPHAGAHLPPPQPGTGYLAAGYPGMAPAPYVPVDDPAQRRYRNRAQWSLVCSLLAFLAGCFFGVPGVILSAMAISFGVQGRKSHSLTSMATVGIVIGGIGLAWNIVFTIAFIATI